MPPRRKLHLAAPRQPRRASPRHDNGGGGVAALLRATCALPPGWAVNPVTLRSEPRLERDRAGGGAVVELAHALSDAAVRSGDRPTIIALLPEAERVMGRWTDPMPANAEEKRAVLDLAAGRQAEAERWLRRAMEPLSHVPRDNRAHVEHALTLARTKRAAAETAAPALRVSSDGALQEHMMCALVHAVASGGGAGDAMGVLSAWSESRRCSFGDDSDGSRRRHHATRWLSILRQEEGRRDRVVDEAMRRVVALVDLVRIDGECAARVGEELTVPRSPFAVTFGAAVAAVAAGGVQRSTGEWVECTLAEVEEGLYTVKIDEDTEK
eukprot:gene34599-52343_t